MTTDIVKYLYTISTDENITQSALIIETTEPQFTMILEQIRSGVYVHVAAVDGAGNIEEIFLKKVPIQTESQSPSQSPTASRSPTELLTDDASFSYSLALIYSFHVSETKEIIGLFISSTFSVSASNSSWIYISTNFVFSNINNIIYTTYFTSCKK